MGYVFKVKVDKHLSSNIHKNVPINIIIYSPQGNIHSTTQDDARSSIVSRLIKVLDFSSLTSSFCRWGGRKLGLKKRTKSQRIMNELVSCESSNQQLLTLKQYEEILS